MSRNGSKVGKKWVLTNLHQVLHPKTQLLPTLQTHCRRLTQTHLKPTLRGNKLGSQHPSPDLKNSLRVRAVIWLKIITSRHFQKLRVRFVNFPNITISEDFFVSNHFVSEGIYILRGGFPQGALITIPDKPHSWTLCSHVLHLQMSHPWSKLLATNCTGHKACGNSMLHQDMTRVNSYILPASQQITDPQPRAP